MLKIYTSPQPYVKRKLRKSQVKPEHLDQLYKLLVQTRRKLAITHVVSFVTLEDVLERLERIESMCY